MRRIATFIIAACCAVAAVAAPLDQVVDVTHRTGGSPVIPVTATTPDLMAAHFINVGQGSAELFEFSCGLVLIDTGGQTKSSTDWQARLVSYLDEVFARRPDLNRTIDVVYLTHPHPDHTAGVKNLLAGSPFKIRHVITDAEPGARGAPGQKKLIDYANMNRIPAAAITTDLIDGKTGLWSRYIDPLRCRGSDPDLTVLWGSYPQRAQWSKDDAKDANNHSVAVRIKFGDSSFLVTGDMETPAIKAMMARAGANTRLFDVDVYVVGHHGSANATTKEFLAAMSPQMAVISAGDPGAEEVGGFTAFHHGHPNRQAIDLLMDAVIGVSWRRPPVTVAVGTRGQSPDGRIPPAWTRMAIDRAIFSTGWDGDVVIVAGADGSKRVIVN